MDLDPVAAFAQKTADIVSRNSDRLTTLETDWRHLNADREHCSERHTEAIKGLQTSMSTLSEEFRTHAQDEKLRQASWATWEKLALGLIAAMPTIIAAIILLLAREGSPVVKNAVEMLTQP